MMFKRRLGILSLGLVLVCTVVFISDSRLNERWQGWRGLTTTVSENGEDSLTGGSEDANRAVDTLMIDPGHGGIDGGAVTGDSISEKDINLAIGLALKSLAESEGWKVVMTRDRDCGLYRDVINDGTDDYKIQGKRSIRSLKTEDLNERKKLADEVLPAAYVSIHLNSFKEDPRVHGAQVFYSAAGSEAVQVESKALGESIQQALITGLDDGTNRVAMGKKDVIILKAPKVPTVIVECGFLSNPEEAERLQTPEYQKKIASCIYQGILSQLEKPESPGDLQGETNIRLSDNKLV